MKNILWYLILLSCSQLNAQVNLILNPNFEQGSVPNAAGQIDYATYWSDGCGVQSFNGLPVITSDLYDAAIENGGPMCRFDVPVNRHHTNLPGKIGNRYAGFISGGPNTPGEPLNDYGEAIRGTFSQALAASCTYNFKMHIANAERRIYNPGNGLGTGNCDETSTPYIVDPGKIVEVVLRKDDDCDLEKVVLTFNLNDSQSWSAYEGSFSLNQQDAAEGYNRFEVRRAFTSNDLRIAFDAFSLYVDPDALDLIPSISGDDNFCSGDPLTFIGDEGPGTPNVHMWEIAESDEFGNLIAGGFTWNTWITGAPGTYTFPSNLNLVCNRYYRVAMVLVNDCYDWIGTTKVIRINCNPKVPKSANYRICEGDCITLADGVLSLPNYEYHWYSNHQEINNGNQLPLTVCPDEPTVYTLIVVDQTTGCSSVANFQIGLEYVGPDWSHSENTSNNNYYTITAVANNLNTSGIPGFGYAWKIEKLDQNQDPVCQQYNASCWWTHPAPTNFRSFNGIDCSIDCNFNQPGKFQYDTYYRITRGTWSDNCRWRQQSKIFYTSGTRAGNGQRAVIVEEVQLPSLEAEMKNSRSEVALPVALAGLEVYPNPNDGMQININASDLAMGEGTALLTLFSLDGRLVFEKQVEVSNNEIKANLNLANEVPGGVYFLRMMTQKDTRSQRIIIR